MNIKINYIVLSMILISCGAESARNTSESTELPIAGTWKLLKGTLIEKGNTTVTDYTKNTSFIKILNDTHFAFLQHDLKKGKDSAVFVAGGGRYTLKDSSYTEHLEYCSDRQWEGNDFKFTVSIKNDTLVIKGIENVESAGVDRENIEQYVTVK